MKQVKSVPRMVSANVVTAQRRPSVSRNKCGKANFKPVGENTRSGALVARGCERVMGHAGVLLCDGPIRL